MSLNLAIAQEDRGEQLAIDSYYQVVTDNNLFRPLGWTRPDNRPKYQLLGTKIPEDNQPRMALIEETNSHRINYVSIGGQLNEARIEKIEPNQVILSEQEQVVVLRNNAFQLLNLGRSSSNSSRGKNRIKSANSRRRVETNRNQNSTSEEGIQKLRQRFQNASEEKREQMRQQFRQRFSDRRGGRGG